ncbi:hypothetical protein JMN32_15045 [Fulvivirga sp. 29W222]|uniref:RHS repeat-associated core domain-containing protein n=1 Tax=Fulvivirga marina TaxID=2494733 RepID=A0A937KEY3_9BACT|nr:RHS repeat-associated core domain-containing protein [Fulvivirga marina]MBL6447633.1 hypothetical protein [Fulvivirga marina]
MLTEGKVVQSNNYYPFGLQQNTSWTRMDQTPNAHKFNAATEYNDFTDTYDTPFRQYDPATGRFNGVDALAHMTPTLTPYRFGFNNPVSFNDPTGLTERPIILDSDRKTGGGGSILSGADNVFSMSWLSGGMGRASIGSGRYHRSYGYKGSGKGYRYSSVSAMATDAWNATPENGWSITTFENGYKTGFASGTMGSLSSLGGKGHGSLRVYNKYAGKAVGGNKFKGAYVYDFEALTFLANQGGTLEWVQNGGDPSWRLINSRHKDPSLKNWRQVGMTVEIGADAPGYTNLRWVQTVTTNRNTTDHPVSPFVDGVGTKPYYYPDYDKRFHNYKGYDIVFQDNPDAWAYSDRNTNWMAETSLVGMRDGKMERIFTLTWGFEVNGFNVTLFHPAQVTNPSNFHLNSLPK